MAATSPAAITREEALRRLGRDLDEGAARRLDAAAEVPDDVIVAFAHLADQAVRMGIDYRSLGVGWHHPSSRTAYREARHRSILAPASRERADASRQELLRLAGAVADGQVDGRAALTEAFVREIGLQPGAGPAEAASFGGVAAALHGEILLPLRALNECEMTRTFQGAPLPVRAMSEVVSALTRAVLSGPEGFSEWRYTNPVGREQMRGLSEEQIASWREPTQLQHPKGLVTHEDAPGELGFFWATKIGGPSHGFDYESQCVLPLLANARHKVLLLSDPRWPHHPAGRAHWRLLWASPAAGAKRKSGAGEAAAEPRLWLETVNSDFEANGLNGDAWEAAALAHAVAKAETMRVPLSVESSLADGLKRAVRARGARGSVSAVRERIVLRPSNAVVEASDYLSSEHDWVQTSEEVTEAIARALFVPE